MTSVNTPIPFEDWVLSLPRKIDFISYYGGSGGEFFTSLVALSCFKSKHLLDSQECVYTHSGKLNIPKYHSADYKLRNVKSFIDATSHMMTSDEIIKNLKSSIFNSMIKNYSVECKNTEFDDYVFNTENPNVIKNRLEKIYKNTLLIKRSHFVLFDEDKMNALNSSKYWNIVNIDPITLEGKKCAVESIRYFYPNISRYIDDLSFNQNKNIINFPFFDYMIYEEYDEVKYFLEKRYGSELDFDFIDKSLKDYYKLRIIPFLK